MTTNRVHPIVRICLLSAFLALALFSFLAFGSGRAHAQTVSSTTTTVVSRIIVNSKGFLAFSPNAVTVASGTIVKVVNRTIYTVRLTTAQGFVALAPGAVLKIVATQSQTVSFLCRPITLTITVA